MLKIRIILGTAAAVAALALTACGGKGGSSGNANVRLIDATLTHPTLSLLANGTVVITQSPIDTVSAYAPVSAGSPTLQVNDGSTGTALATLAPSVGGDAHYVMVAYETGGSIRTALIAEDVAVPTTTTAALRVFQGATDAGAIDVYVTDQATDIATLTTPSFTFASATSLQTSPFLTIAPGTYRVRVTGAGNPTDLRLDMPSITLASQQVAAIILTPTIGGTLVNGSLLAQQGTYTAGRNTNARVRLAAAVSGNAVVSASAAASAVASVTSPSVSAYAIVPAATPLNVVVAGASVAGPAALPAAGSDSTLLVYGSPGSAVASLVADDNHSPATTTNLKLRLVNGRTGTATVLTLDASFAVIASNVQPGTASSYGIVAASTALPIQVFSATSPTPIYDTTLSVTGTGVYTLFLLGDSATLPPIALLRKDR